jgi:ribosomal protein S18 acetylase RimI-like enzyme
MRSTERAAIQRLGTALFAPFGDYGDALHRWLRSPSVITSVVDHPDEGLVGFTLLGLLHEAGGEGQAYLLGIGVAPQWRRRGLGRLLLDASLGEARKRSARWGVHDLRLEVASANRSARQLFEDAGFATIEAAPDSRSYPTGDQALTMTLPLT